MLREALWPHRDEIAPRLWAALQSAGNADARVLSLASALAHLAPEDKLWGECSDRAAQALVKVAPELLDLWLELLHPVGNRLTLPLAAIFRTRGGPESLQELATRSLIAYARDDPRLLAGLLLDASPKAFRSLFPAIQGSASKVEDILRAELTRPAENAWRDMPLDPSWKQTEPALNEVFRSAHGRLEERFASCQTMPLDVFGRTAEVLRESGYRPVRLRPFVSSGAVRVAGVWCRDGKPWRLARDLAADALRSVDADNQAHGFIPVDVAGYIANADGGSPVVRYAALWVQGSHGDGSRMYIGLSEDDLNRVHDELSKQDLAPRTYQMLNTPGESPRISGIWGRPATEGVATLAARDLFESHFTTSRVRRGDEVLLDVSIGTVERRPPVRERARIAAERATKRLKTVSSDREALKMRAMAELTLDEPAKALEDLSVSIGTDNDAAECLPYRAIARARLGSRREALADLQTLHDAYVPADLERCIAAVVAAELGDEVAKAFEPIESAIARDPQNPEVVYQAARAYSLASKPVGTRNPMQGKQLAARAGPAFEPDP